MTALRIDRFAGRGEVDPVMLRRARDFSSAIPDGRMRIESVLLCHHGMKPCFVRSNGHEVALSENDHIDILLPLRERVNIDTTSTDRAALPGRRASDLCQKGCASGTRAKSVRRTFPGHGRSEDQ